MAMRGSGDTSLDLTDAQAIVVLGNVIETQRDILTQVFNGTNIEDIPQMWCLYSEVQGYYENEGLRVPDDITLLWTDDNYGNVRRLPVGNETERTGGAGMLFLLRVEVKGRSANVCGIGVYYHIDFVGGVRDYKWINTIQLEKTVEQVSVSSFLIF